MEKYPGKVLWFASGSLVWGHRKVCYNNCTTRDKRRIYQFIFSNWKHEYNDDFKKIVDYLENIPYDEELMHKMSKTLEVVTYIEVQVYLILFQSGNHIMNNILCIKWGDSMTIVMFMK